MEKKRLSQTGAVEPTLSTLTLKLSQHPPPVYPTRGCPQDASTAAALKGLLLCLDLLQHVLLLQSPLGKPQHDDLERCVT